MKKTAVFLLAFLSVASFFAGCGETNCPLVTTSFARFAFLDSRTHRPVSLTSGATVTGIANIEGQLDIDTLFNQVNDYMSVPLSYTDQTTYVIHYTETMRDTIVVKHKNIPFVSEIDCGAMMFYEVEDFRFTTNALDSVTLVNSNITNEEKNNFYIYYRATDAE